MFEAGGQLKARFGAENVYDFSLGNPDLPAPSAVAEGLRDFAEHAGEPFAFGYMPNGGFPWLREKLAAHLSAEQGVKLAADDVLLSCGAAGGLNAFLRAVIDRRIFLHSGGHGHQPRPVRTRGEQRHHPGGHDFHYPQPPAVPAH